MSLGELRTETGLVAGYNFNGNSNDFSGSGLNGTDTNITYSQANGKFGQGAGFNSASPSSISIPTSSSLDLIYPFTIEGWIKTSTASGTLGIFARSDNAYSTDAIVKIYLFAVVNGALLFYRRTSNGSNDANPNLAGTRAVADGKWHHVALTLSSTTAILYVDGSLDTTGTITGTNITFGSNVSFFGKYWNGSAGASNPFNGAMDRFNIFTVAKSASWVRQQYSLGRFGEL